MPLPFLAVTGSGVGLAIAFILASTLIAGLAAYRRQPPRRERKPFDLPAIRVDGRELSDDAFIYRDERDAAEQPETRPDGWPSKREPQSAYLGGLRTPPIE